jgi:hypothetical protein
MGLNGSVRTEMKIKQEKTTGEGRFLKLQRGKDV